MKNIASVCLKFTVLQTLPFIRAVSLMRDVSSEEAANNYTMLVGGAQCSPMDTCFLPPNDSCQT